MNIKCIIKFVFLYVASSGRLVKMHNVSIFDICPMYKKGRSLNVQELVGSWMTVFTQPKAIDCFKFDIRATTELEREQYILKYGNFSGNVDWNSCYLQVEAPIGKHFLQGDGTKSGVMENVIITEEPNGEYLLQNQSADQWMVFGRRGTEVLMIRDCFSETAAAFARAPYWPTAKELSAIFHRSGIKAQTHGRMLCEPLDNPTRQHHIYADPYKSKRNCL